MAIVVQRYESFLYDGENAEEVIEWVPSSTYRETREDGTLVFDVSAWDQTWEISIPVNSWALRCGGIPEGSVTAERYASAYYELPGT